ncbi:hypothetical protein FOA52_005128 [Chlamydomonas sp. UWO 241]|nr:hypothetical protein FOA52_005128 [Chlamydomonas sp. UWO 241]
MQLNAGQPRRLVNGPSVRTDYRLLECSEDLLATIISEGVVLKGGANDEAVLCTSSKTFAVKLVETTNLQMLVDPSAEVTGAQMLVDPSAEVAGTQVRSILQSIGRL